MTLQNTDNEMNELRKNLNISVNNQNDTNENNTNENIAKTNNENDVEETVNNEENDVENDAENDAEINNETVNDVENDVEDDTEGEVDEEIDIFADTDEFITIETKEVIPEHERVYLDDKIYIEDLENQFLSELPIEDQNSKYYQERISEKVRDIIELKNLGKKTLDRDNNYPFILDHYLNNQYSTSWLIPVVIDKQRIYSPIDVKTGVNTDDVEEIEEERESIEMTSLVEQLAEYDRLEKEYTYKNITFEKFLKQTTKLIRPFILLEELNNKDVGFKVNLKSNTNLLRYFDINNSHWQERIGSQPISIIIEELDEEKKTKTVIKKVIVEGEEINIVGFFLLPKNVISLTELVSNGITRFTKIGDISNITTGTKTIITLNNHKLETGDFIVIKDNSLFSGNFKVNVIDDDKITIDYDSSGEEIDKMGEVYGNLVLPHKTINIKRNNKKDFYLDDKNLYDGGMLYLFDNEKLDEEDFKQILKLVVPSLDDIMVRQEEELKKAKFMKNINGVLRKYDITYNDINIEQFDTIKNYLKKHIKDEEDEIDKLRKEYDKLDKNVMDKDRDFPDTLYANKYFYDKNITDVYGTYPLKESIYDTIENRMLWINNHNDFGDYYYNFIVLQTDYNEKDIRDTLKSVRTSYETQQKAYEKEKTMDKYFKKCSKFVKEYSNLEELQDDKTTYEEGDFAILVSKKSGGVNVMLDKSKIYKWKNGKWEFVEETKENSIVYLCGLEGENVEELKSINCIYTLEGCKSKRLYKIEKKVDISRETIEDYEGLLKFIENKDIIIKKRLEDKKIVLNRFIQKPKEVEIEEVEETLESKIPLSIVQILGRIIKVKNEYARRHLMFQLLEKDGISIGNIVYSKKYQGYLMCGHYVYLKKEEYTNDNSIKEMIRSKMLVEFGDDGKSIAGQQTCKVCGAYLSEVAFDTSPSFNEFGVPVITREQWVEESKTVHLAMMKDSEKIVCKSQSYRGDLMAKGFNMDQVETGIKICETLQSISNKIGIKLLKSDFMDTVGDILEQFLVLPPYPVFRKKSVLASITKGVSKEKVQKMDEMGIFKSAYSKFITLKKYSIIASRLLITIQTAVPPYQRKRPITACTFSSWSGKYGVEYLSCILIEMKVMMYKDKDDKMKSILMGEVIDEIFKSLRLFQDNVRIKKMFSKRFIYDKSLPVVQSNKVIDKEVIKPMEVEALPNDFIKKMLSNDNVKELREQLYGRSSYLGYLIKSLIKEATSGEEMIMPMNIQENACCLEGIDGYKYGNFINAKTGDRLRDVMKETWEISPYHQYFVWKGMITKMFVNPKRIVYTHNGPMEQVINESLIKEKFKMYCYTGITRGQIHYFIGEDKNKKCVKCGKYLEEIEKSEFTREEFDKLLDDIKELKYKVPDLKEVEELVDVKKLKKENLSQGITSLINKLSKILGKPDDKIFKERYENLLNQLGNYENYFKKDEDGRIENIEIDKDTYERYETFTLIDNEIENRIHLLKLYINQYFRRYISIIANNYKIRDMSVRIPYVSSEISKDLQKTIYDDYDLLAQYFTETNAEIFKELKFEYSIQEVNSIYGNSDRYNCLWSEILEKSEFDLSSASDVLLYILISNLNNFLLVKEPVVVANFIISMFDVILSDTSTFDMTKKEIKKYETTIYYELYCKYFKEIKTSSSQANKTFLKNQSGVNLVSDGTIDIGSLIEQQSQMDIDASRYEQQEEQIEKMAMEKFGADATGDQIEAFKEKYYENERKDEYTYTNEFNMMQPKEDDEILEVGDDYGYMEQGTENEGDGVSVYTQEEFRDPSI